MCKKVCKNGRPGLVSGLASIKLKNLNYSFQSIFGVIETKLRVSLSIFGTFDHLLGYLRSNLG